MRIPRENLAWKVDELRESLKRQPVADDCFDLAAYLCKLTLAGHGDYRTEAVSAYRQLRHLLPPTELDQAMGTARKRLAELLEKPPS
jgi:hypothetical protein